jgi:hypothetical protein
MGLIKKILWFFLIDYYCRYVEEDLHNSKKVAVYHESWYQWFGIKFNKNRFIVSYENKKEEK